MTVETIAIVDYGLCNLDSVRRAVEECGGRPLVTARPEDVAAASRVILPGVGAFPDAMDNLRGAGLVEALQRRVVEERRPFLGICLGLQLMASRSDEGRSTPGLGWIDADVRRIDPGPDGRVPHIGWNEVERGGDEAVFARVPSRADFYFVHSYALCPADTGCVIGWTPYGTARIVSAVRRDNMWGLQFHPEKSQRNGFQVLRNFIAS